MSNPGDRTTRREYNKAVGTLALLDLGFSDWFGDDEPEGSIIAVDDADERSDYDPDEYDVFFAIDTGSVYREDEINGGWQKLKATGRSPVFDSVVIDNLQTKNIGVSASLSSNQSVDTGTETRLAIDDTSSPYFDDFGELDASANKIVLKYDSHHEIVAHAALQSASAAGQIWLRIYLNGVEMAHDHIDVKNAEEGVLETSINLKLDKGDEIEARVQHDTGSTETFSSDLGNFVSCIRQ